MEYPVYPCGDCAATVQIGQVISEQVNGAVVRALEAIRRAAIPGVRELVPSYAAICIHYDPEMLSWQTLQDALRQVSLEEPAGETEKPGREICIPVCYGGAFGPDLPFVAAHSGLSEEEVVRRHSGGSYLVYMLGFLPGFAYLGGMDECIACPRLETPRTRIPAGAVGIAGGQTGIYPLASPGGWQLIGRTPLRMFRMEAGQGVFALSAGDRVRFVPIDAVTFREMEERT